MSKEKKDKARLLLKPTQLSPFATARDGVLCIARGLSCLFLFIFSVFANLALIFPRDEHKLMCALAASTRWHKNGQEVSFPCVERIGRAPHGVQSSNQTC